MKRTPKVLLALLCAFALVAGTAVATGVITTRTLQAQYMDIKLTVDGQAVTPKDANGTEVEPFMVDGTVYLPVRAVAQALGRGVEWDPSTRTVAVLAPLLQDAKYLVETIEATHPCFVLDDVPQGYEAAKAAFLETAAKPGLSTVDFAWACMAYTSSLKDGHTLMWGMVGGMPQVDVRWAADGEQLYLLDEDGALTKRQVTAIGGVAVKDVFAVVDAYFVSENNAYADKNHSTLTGLRAVLQMAGADVTGDKTVLTVVENGKETQVAVALTAPVANGAREVVISHQQKGDVFYIDFNACMPGDEVDATAKALSDAVKAGTTKVIIDVRGNGGGDSLACEQLLEAMGMAAPGYGMYLRTSDLMRATYPEQMGELKEDLQYERDPSTAVQNPNIKLVVLTDEYTFSSATMMGVFVQDGKLGTLIGRASSNAPSAYGDILPFTLANSQFQGGVSFKQFQRPDKAADQKTLVPDLETKLGEDALQAALDFLSKK